MTGTVAWRLMIHKSVDVRDAADAPDVQTPRSWTIANRICNARRPFVKFRGGGVGGQSPLTTTAVRQNGPTG